MTFEHGYLIVDEPRPGSILLALETDSISLDVKAAEAAEGATYYISSWGWAQRENGQPATWILPLAERVSTEAALAVEEAYGAELIPFPVPVTVSMSQGMLIRSNARTTDLRDPGTFLAQGALFEYEGFDVHFMDQVGLAAIAEGKLPVTACAAAIQKYPEPVRVEFPEGAIVGSATNRSAHSIISPGGEATAVIGQSLGEELLYYRKEGGGELEIVQPGQVIRFNSGRALNFEKVGNQTVDGYFPLNQQICFVPDGAWGNGERSIEALGEPLDETFIPPAWDWDRLPRLNAEGQGTRTSSMECPKLLVTTRELAAVALPPGLDASFTLPDEKVPAFTEVILLLIHQHESGETYLLLATDRVSPGGFRWVRTTNFQINDFGSVDQISKDIHAVDFTESEGSAFAAALARETRLASGGATRIFELLKARCGVQDFSDFPELAGLEYNFTGNAPAREPVQKPYPAVFHRVAAVNRQFGRTQPWHSAWSGDPAGAREIVRRTEIEDKATTTGYGRRMRLFNYSQQALALNAAEGVGLTRGDTSWIEARLAQRFSGMLAEINMGDITNGRMSPDGGGYLDFLYYAKRLSEPLIDGLLSFKGVSTYSKIIRWDSERAGWHAFYDHDTDFRIAAAAGMEGVKVSLEEVRGKLRPGEALLVYFQSNDPFLNSRLFTDMKERLWGWKEARSGSEKYGAVLIKGAGDPQFHWCGRVAECDQPVLALRDYVPAGPKEMGEEERSRRVDDLLTEAGRRLLTPFADALADVDALIICPEGQLNLLPFDAIPFGGERLGEEFFVRVINAPRDLVMSVADEGGRAKEAMLIGDPNYRSAAPLQALVDPTEARRMPDAMRSLSQEGARLGLKPLPGTALEVRELAKLLEEAGWLPRILTRDDADELAVMDTPAAANILHLATHGFFLDRTPLLDERDADSAMLRSGVALAGAGTTMGQWGRGRVPDPNRDGILTAAEVSSMTHLQGLELVVLSACETAVGESVSGEGVSGLRTALAVAGVKNALLTLWPVDDEVTVAIITDFYREYLGGKHPSQALAVAKRKHFAIWEARSGTATAISLVSPFICTSTGTVVPKD